MSQEEGSVLVSSEKVAENKKGALSMFRIFSFYASASYGLYLVLFIAILSSYGFILREEAIANKSILPLTPYLTILALIFIAGTVLQIISVLYLRGGFKSLKAISKSFSTPYAGLGIYFASIIIVFIFGFIIVAAELGFLHSLDGYDTIWWLILFIGVAAGFAGEILGLTLGSFRLKEYFDDTNFMPAGILFLLALAVPIFGIIASILIYRGANSLVRKQNNVRNG